MVPNEVPGKIKNSGFYKDCVPVMTIAISKEFCGLVPHTFGERKEVPFIVDGVEYQAGVRATEKMIYLKICQDLIGKDGKMVRLADLLRGHGLTTTDSVTLRVTDQTIELIT